MKHIHTLLILSLTLFAAVSCLNSKNSQQLTMDVSFEDDALEFDPVDSTCFHPFVAFANLVGFSAVLDDEEENLLGGFVICRGVDPTLTGEAAKTAFHCISHPYLKTEKTFAVFRQSTEMPETHITFNVPNEQSSFTPRGVMLNNTHDFVQMAKLGDGLSGNKFTDGDWAEVTFTGYKNGVETGSATQKMAEFAGAKEEVLTEWTLLDLSPLGSVDRIDVTLTSSRENAFRLVCLDHLNLSISLVF
jgi:hypothetical protein